MRLRRAVMAMLPIAFSLAIGACSFDIDKWFERDDPSVEEARRTIAEAGPEASEELQAARIALEEMLRFRCEGDGGLDIIVDRPGAALDLGLVIFRLSELIGRRFGEEELADGGGSAEGDELMMSARVKQLDCAHLLLLKMASDPKTPSGLALRARYLLGNIAFLARRYKDAVGYYDEVLLRHPARGNDPATEVGPPNDDDAVARFAAWNRAIALERLLPPDAGDAGDTGDESAADSGSDGSNEGGDGGDGGGADSGTDGSDGSNDTSDGGGNQDGASDTGSGQGETGQDSGAADTSQQSQPPPQPSPSAMPSSSAAVDIRELDRFDQKAPLDLDFKARLREKRKIPKKFDK
jgi:hypothetical protein